MLWHECAAFFPLFPDASGLLELRAMILQSTSCKGFLLLYSAFWRVCVSQRRMLTLEDTWDFRLITEMRLAPDGRRMAFTT